MSTAVTEFLSILGMDTYGLAFATGELAWLTYL